jgi:wobble nucleotide-excising tRNase
MIESMSISKVATYGDQPEVLSGLSQFNFIFGSNGAGKTTISRVIAEAEGHNHCGIAWKGGIKLEAMIYNRDFVDRNFNESSSFKGIFTLGEQQTETLTKIASTKADIDTLNNKITSLTENLQGQDGLSGKKGELMTLENQLKEKCWTQKQRYDNTLQGGFEGYRGSAEKFKIKVLHELSNNSAVLCDFAELQKRASSIFGTTPTTEQVAPEIESSRLLGHESNPILKKRVIGKEDVDIAAMIKKLGNSDWVRQGKRFFDVNNKVCPFCQQSTNESFTKNLEEYFDETFIADTAAIEALNSNYLTDAERLQQQIATIMIAPSRFLDIEKLKSEKQLLDSKITINQQRLAEKKKEASQVIELESLSNTASEINSLIDATNTQISEHNVMVANLASERRNLTSQVWKFVLEELKTDLSAYTTNSDNLNKAITSLSLQIEKANVERQTKSAELRQLEKQTTSVQPTIDAINALLKSFGFIGFSLTKAGDASYRLVRADGSDAKATLSEGEKTFVTFLYFYHLLKGSNTESGITADRVVVIDDPVSSLDSDVLFIVSSLIKGLFDEIRVGQGYIKQVFVLTHNVYFHKEVSFNPKRPVDKALSEETFWIVRKDGLQSKSVSHSSNPIKTSYELLWADVKKPSESSLSIQNTLRRILENYFKILGGINPDKIYESFDGKNKFVCKSLFSWVNDGSHSVHDDLYVSNGDTAVESYLRIFKEIFEKSGHIAHYQMMMGEILETKVA